MYEMKGKPMQRFSEDAMNRPRRTLQAIEVLRGKAMAIAHVTANAKEDEIVVVVVQADGDFGGIWTLAREDMVKQMKVVEDKAGWSFTFSPHTSSAQVEQRCDELARIVNRRLQGMQRRMERKDS